MEMPKVSVIIPMYNAEKYLVECLESLLTQTFQDFEVIIVDDCSTDNSVAIAKSFMRNFGMQFFLIHTEKNSGNFGYTARNKGFNSSRGEYVFFMDADDVITNTALEELYTAAKNFNADIVYTGARYLYTSDKGAELRLDKEGRLKKKKGIAEEATLIANNQHKLLEYLLLSGGVFWASWTKFVRREFLVEKGITFYENFASSDFVWTIELFCCAERFLRIPTAVYFWRMDSIASVTHKKRESDNQITTWNKAFFYIARTLANLADKREILNENPLYCYFALKRYLKFCLKSTFEARSELKSEEVYKILWQEFKNSDEFNMPMIFFFSFIDSQQKEINRLKDKE